MSKIESIEVDNLKCQGCAGTITKKISALKGVEDVEVDVEISVVTIHYGELDSGINFYDKLASLGYPPKGTTNTFQKAKSYVSCAIGKVGA
ncbi:MAG: heavy-metal-associated domain-containing protein [Reichenbachiella sp.]